MLLTVGYLALLRDAEILLSGTTSDCRMEPRRLTFELHKEARRPLSGTHGPLVQ